MSEEFNPQRKNPAFLSPFLTESLYNIPADLIQESQQDEAGEDTTADNAPHENAPTNEPIETGQHDNLKSHLQQENATHSVEASSTADESYDTASNPLPYKTDEATADTTQESAENQEPDQSTASEPDYTQEEEPPVDYYGDINKQVVIFTAYQNQKNLITKDKLVLTRILKALNLQLEDVAVINVHKAQLNFEKLKQNFNFQQIIGFGISPEFFPKPVHLNEVKYLIEGEAVTMAPPIEEIAASKEYKKQLWRNLKTIFQ